MQSRRVIEAIKWLDFPMYWHPGTRRIFVEWNIFFKYLRGSDQPHTAKQGFDIPGSVNLYELV